MVLFYLHLKALLYSKASDKQICSVSDNLTWSTHYKRDMRNLLETVLSGEVIVIMSDLTNRVL